MKPDLVMEEIATAVEQLRTLSADGPRRRKLLDELFRNVHNVKAVASARGLVELAAAAHELENVLHELRTARVSEALAEGARLFLVHTSFDVADFEQRFQSLKEILNRSGEVISVSPIVENERTDKLNFRILYAHTSKEELPNTSDVKLEETSLPAMSATSEQFDLSVLERCLENLTKQISKLHDAPTETAFQQAVRAGQAAALATGKEVDFEIRGEDLSLDERVANPLIHLVRNAVDHGIEQKGGKVVIEAIVNQQQIRVRVTDNGRGIHPAILDRIFQPGFSTANAVTEISGRGVGLDAVKTAIEELGGSITVSSEPREGTCFEITIPIHNDPR
ncbi:MAG TPA: ATP-binding protein [Pyrinomonadaceae bacterium]|nr:ATP-binding protein [Pyrinomonadaceae bacterium]